jgi:hypothetical protein
MGTRWRGIDEGPVHLSGEEVSSSSPGDRASDGSCLLPEVAHAATDHQIPRRVVLVLVLVLVLSELVTTRRAPVGRTVTVRTEADASRVIYVSDGSRMPVQHLPGEIGRLGLWIARDISVHPTGQGEIVCARFVRITRQGCGKAGACPQAGPGVGGPVTGPFKRARSWPTFSGYYGMRSARHW